MTDKQEMGLDPFIESVIKVDEDLRSQAREQECLDELLHTRESVLEYLYKLRKK